MLLCHVTSSGTSPYSVIEVASPAAVNAHLGHGDVATVNGECPGPVVPPAPGGTVTICHRTGTSGAPFELLAVGAVDLAAHLAHGDVGTVGGVCPGAVVLSAMFSQNPVVVPVRQLRAEVLGESFESEVRAQLVSAPVQARTTDRGGSLARTGVESGPLVLIALLLLLVGARLVHSGNRRSAASVTSAVAAPGVASPALPGFHSFRGLAANRSRAPGLSGRPRSPRSR